LRGDLLVDDLPELVDGAVYGAPPAGDLHIGFVRKGGPGRRRDLLFPDR
jgi:hypothetical protein